MTEGIDNMIESLQRLSKVDVRAASLAAPLVQAAIQKTAGAGQTPAGASWPAKKSGGRAMVNAAKHVRAEAVGAVVRVTLEGPDVFHHYGKTGEPRRQVIPDVGETPAPVVAAVRAAGLQAIDEATR